MLYRAAFGEFAFRDALARADQRPPFALVCGQ